MQPACQSDIVMFARESHAKESNMIPILIQWTKNIKCDTFVAIVMRRAAEQILPSMD